jgi:hypothetical protein
MTELERPGIKTYLNPDHWLGNTLGVGNYTGERPRTALKGYDQAYARRTLLESGLGNSAVPLHTFYLGDTFDPAAFSPGTVVLFARETLSGPPVARDSVDDLQQQPVPLRFVDTSPRTGPAAPRIFVTDTSGQYIYRAHSRWGVIPDKRNADYLCSAYARHSYSTNSGIGVASNFTKQQGPIAVGETKHYTPNSVGSELLARINIVHVMASGLPARQAKRRWFFAGGLATRQAT